MNSRVYQLLVVNLGLAILYAIQRKIAYRIADAVEGAILKNKYQRDMERRLCKPYPKPRKKNLYYRDNSDWE